MRAAVRAWAERVFTDRLMAELAVLLIAPAVLHMVRPLSPWVLRTFDVLGNGILAVFVLEYVVKLCAAESRRKFFFDPWHVMDLLILALAGLDFVPALRAKGARASPLLRLLRLARLSALTGRAIKRAGSPRHLAASQGAPTGPARINILEEGSLFRDTDWKQTAASVKDPRETWVDLQDVSRQDLDMLSSTFGIPRHVLESKLFQEAFPGIDYFSDYTALVLSGARPWGTDGESLLGGTPTPNVVVICARDFISTLCTGQNRLFDRLVQHGLLMEGEPFGVRVLYAILHQKIADYGGILRGLEQRVAELEDIPVGGMPQNFLDETFQLKKLIQRQDYNLRHFTQALAQVKSRKVVLHSIRDESLDLFVLLHGEAEALEETCRTIRENLLGLLDLQMNKVSFDLNRVMRILAVITCVATIPSVIGGLLGQNLLNQPYPATLQDIVFVVCFLAVVCLYVFHRKGWLK